MDLGGMYTHHEISSSTNKMELKSELVTVLDRSRQYKTFNTLITCLICNLQTETVARKSHVIKLKTSPINFICHEVSPV